MVVQRVCVCVCLRVLCAGCERVLLVLTMMQGRDDAAGMGLLRHATHDKGTCMCVCVD
jgi:hypothetical protein